MIDQAVRVAALCVAPRSVYKGMPGVDAFDVRRDVRSFAGGCPVVAHPPCRLWSARCRHQAKAPDSERDLGLLCAHWLRRCGGVLEHPAHSLLFEAAELPFPGCADGNLWSISVPQSWWGYPTAKNTWLCFGGIHPSEVEFPLRLAGGGSDERRWQVMSAAQRSATHPEFARWLVDQAAKAR